MGIVDPNSPENGVTLPTYPQYTLSSGEVDFGTCPNGDYEAQETLSKYVIVLGQGSAWWTGGRPHAGDECGGGPCRSYVGDKQIAIEPVEADFTVTAAPTAINFEDTVTVTAAVSPGQVGGLNMPFTIDSTKWALSVRKSRPVAGPISSGSPLAPGRAASHLLAPVR